MKRIDIAQVLRQKAPALYAKMPGFVVRLVEWIVCQRQLNDILEHCDMHQGADFAVAMSEYLGVTYTVRGMENITADGRYMMVSNHPLGGFDGISYIALLGKKILVLETSAAVDQGSSAAIAWVTLAVTPESVSELLSASCKGTIHLVLPGGQAAPEEA